MLFRSGGRGNGKGFDIDDFMDDFNSENLENSVDSQTFPQNPNDITEDSDIGNGRREGHHRMDAPPFCFRRKTRAFSFKTSNLLKCP